MAEDKPQLSIEHLKKKHKDLEAKKIAAQTNLEHAEKQLEELRSQAREQWGTDDLEALRQKLEDMKADNENQRQQYQQHIEQIETRLAAIEQQFAETRASNR